MQVSPQVRILNLYPWQGTDNKWKKAIMFHPSTLRNVIQNTIRAFSANSWVIDYFHVVQVIILAHNVLSKQ